MERLCHKAAHPIRQDILDGLKLPEDFAKSLTCGAVCVYPARVGDATKTLSRISKVHIPVASGINFALYAHH